MASIQGYIILLVLLFVSGSFAAWLRIRRLRIRLLVQTIASIVSQNLPLAPALRAAAGGERGGGRQIYERMAQRLELGADLSTALRWAMLSCPGEVLGAIQAGQRGGTLPSILQTLAADARRAAHEPDAGRRPLWYFFVICGALPLLVAFFCAVVLPKYSEICRDYGVTLPALTQSLVWLGGAAAHWPALALTLVLGLVLLAVQFTLGRHFLVRVPSRFQLGFAAWDTLTWVLPLARTVTGHRALARQLPILQAAVGAGHDLPEAARQAAMVAANLHARWRMLRWAEALERGADPLQAARSLGFPAPVLRVLAAARATGDFPAQLAYLGAYYQSLYQHWERVLAEMAAPLCVVAWGVCVGYLALAMFLPLVHILQTIMASIY